MTGPRAGGSIFPSPCARSQGPFQRRVLDAQNKGSLVAAAGESMRKRGRLHLAALGSFHKFHKISRDCPQNFSLANRVVSAYMKAPKSVVRMRTQDEEPTVDVDSWFSDEMFADSVDECAQPAYSGAEHSVRKDVHSVRKDVIRTHTRAILNEAQAIEIYKQRNKKSCSLSFNGTAVMIARKYNISPKTVRDIWNRRSWVEQTRHLWTDDEAPSMRKKKSPRQCSPTPTNSADILFPACPAVDSFNLLLYAFAPVIHAMQQTCALPSTPPPSRIEPTVSQTTCSILHALLCSAATDRLPPSTPAAAAAATPPPPPPVDSDFQRPAAFLTSESPAGRPEVGVPAAVRIYPPPPPPTI
jgi:hypothetical protein